AIELAGERDQGGIAAGSDLGEDGAHGRLDVGGSFALGGEKGAEPRGKIGGAAVEAERHGPVLPDHTGRVTAQWRGRDRPSTPHGGRIVEMEPPRLRGAG